MRKKVFYIMFLFVFLLIAAEILLRIYNPFPSGIKGNKVVLRVNVRYELSSHGIPVLEDTVVHTKNSLGFRGPEPPKNWDESLTIITVGGSTTECNYISDGKTWSDHLNGNLQTFEKAVWVNNAGLAGHSTFGHQLLLDDYIIRLKPDLVLLLIGCNDVEREDLNASDRSSFKGEYGSFASFFTKNSELVNTIATLSRRNKAITHGLTDTYLDLRKVNEFVEVPEKEIASTVAAIKNEYLNSYRHRVKTLISTCKDAGIEPVLLTQPSLLGEGVDPITGTNLESLAVKMGSARNGKEWWSFLQVYNEVLREVGSSENVLVIDLANKLPKSSLYFYDAIHYSLEGNKIVADIVSSHLQTFVQKNNNQ